MSILHDDHLPFKNSPQQPLQNDRNFSCRKLWKSFILQYRQVMYRLSKDTTHVLISMLFSLVLEGVHIDLLDLLMGM